MFHFNAVIHFITRIYVTRRHKFLVSSKIRNIFCIRRRVVKISAYLAGNERKKKKKKRTAMKHLK